MPKNPLGKIKDVADLAVGTVVDTGQKVVGQAVGQAAGAVGAVASKVPGRKKPAPARPERGLRAVRQDAPAGPHGDPVKPATNVGATKAPGKKTTTKRAPAKKTAAKKTAAKKAPAKRAPAKKTAAKKAPARKSAAKKTAPSGQSSD